MRRTLPTLALLLALAPASIAQDRLPTGNVVFFHPDGTGANHWAAARMYWYGPDAVMNWDRLPHMALYRGHMGDQIVGTSNGGATVHAFGYKVAGPGSFGKDGDGLLNPPTDRSIQSLSGYSGSLLREAAAKGHPIGVVNDGHIGEPGTGAFLAEVGSRRDWEGITKQILLGRPGAEDRRPEVIMGGGEETMLPEGVAGVHGPGKRKDGLNLIETVRADGYEVVRTRAELAALKARLDAEPDFTPRVLGVFARFHTFNDESEEKLIADGFVNPAVPRDDRRSNLVLFGSPNPSSPSFDPPTVAEMTEVALTVLQRHAAKASRPFALVVEPESTDNFGNNNNAIGSLTAMARADQAIGAILEFIEANPKTLVLTAADSDASGLQLDDQEEGKPVGAASTNESAGLPNVENPLDGVYGRGTVAFSSMPDQFGQTHGFGVFWSSGSDVAGGVLSRAAGLNAELLTTRFSARFDSTDVYRVLFGTLFGRLPEAQPGRRAPGR